MLSEIYTRHPKKPSSFILHAFSYLRKWRTVGLFMLLIPAGTKAQSFENYAVNANIVYHFTKYIDWPDDRDTGNFLIGIVGDSPIYDELKKMMVNKTVGTQPIVIKQITPAQVSNEYHILFIAEEQSGNLKKIAVKTSGESVLLVSEEKGLALRGSCINFTIVSEHLKLEINKQNIENRHLNIASELLRLGIIIP